MSTGRRHGAWRLEAMRLAGAATAMALLLLAPEDPMTPGAALLAAALTEAAAWLAPLSARRGAWTALADRLAPALMFLALAQLGWTPFWLAAGVAGLGVLAAHLRLWFGPEAASAPAAAIRRAALGLAPAAILAARAAWPEAVPPNLGEALYALPPLALLAALLEPLAAMRRLPVPQRRRLRLLLEAFAPDTRAGALRLVGLLLAPAIMALLSMGAPALATPALLLLFIGEAAAIGLSRIQRNAGGARLRAEADHAVDALRHTAAFLGLGAAGWSPTWLAAALASCETAAPILTAARQRADPPARALASRRAIYLAVELCLAFIGLGSAGAATLLTPILLAVALLAGLHLVAESVSRRAGY